MPEAILLEDVEDLGEQGTAIEKKVLGGGEPFRHFPFAAADHVHGMNLRKSGCLRGLDRCWGRGKSQLRQSRVMSGDFRRQVRVMRTPRGRG